MALWPSKRTVNYPDCATQLRKLRTAASTALHDMKNTWVKVSHVLRHRDRDNCNGTRQLDCSRAWFRMTFGAAGVHGKHRQQRQLTCTLFKICRAKRTKALWASLWAHKSGSLFSERAEAMATSIHRANLSSGLKLRLSSQTFDRNAAFIRILIRIKISHYRSAKRQNTSCCLEVKQLDIPRISNEITRCILIIQITCGISFAGILQNLQ